MSIKKLASEIAKREGKKTQARIGEVREILSILSDIVADDFGAMLDVLENGVKRQKKVRK